MSINVSKTDGHKELLQKAIEAVEQYRQALDSTSNAGILEEHVYNLFGGRFYADNTLGYGDACVSLLATLADPGTSSQIEKKMGDYEYGNLIDMLHRMRNFCKMMDLNNYRTLFLAYELKNWGESESAECLREIQAEYTIKTEALESRAKIRVATI